MADSTARMIDKLKVLEQTAQSTQEDPVAETEKNRPAKAQQPASECQADNQMQYLLKNCLSPDIPEPEAKR